MPSAAYSSENMRPCWSQSVGCMYRSWRWWCSHSSSVRYCMGLVACAPPQRSGCCEPAGRRSSSRGAAHWPLCGCWLKQFLRPGPPIVVTADRGQDASQLVSLLIPANPFVDLSRNYVPAIVVFCLFYGIAIQRIENKQGVLSGLEVVKRPRSRFGDGWCAWRPVGVFALFAGLAGTIRLEVVGNLFLYVYRVFLGGALILAFWVIPSLIASLVPIGHRELLKELNSAIVIAVVTSLPVTSVPYIVQMS